ncbi:GGDEF domain-containing protein [Aestuariirhabdus sp. LZHN29]|uniref:GGDEF domain-containing protein n=1 Tax=Aestuariirhabdus sp. LZHN29 TaxID=3417462 RepID=UPI003CECFE27
MTRDTILNLGVECLQPGQSPYKVRVTNLVSLITSVIASGYLLYYWFELNSIALGLVNLGFVIAYLAPLWLMQRGLIRSAKAWFFAVLMLHLLVLTTVIMNRDTGIHLYYFLVPAGVFLFFERNERILCLGFSLAAVVLFIICERFGDHTPMIPLSEEQTRWLFRSTVIVCLLEVYVVMSVFTREIEQRENRLHHQASTDPLTGLANRRTLLQQGDILCEGALRYGQPLALLLMDVDHFKQVNDRYGHSAGDAVLVSLSDLMVQACRSSDLVARYGGEEFAILLPGSDQQQALRVAEKIRCLIESHPIDIADDNQISCTLSIGLTCISESRHCFAQLLINADKALYQAKQAGRNRVECLDH